MPQEEATKAGSSLAESAKSKLLAEHVRLLWPSVEAVRTSAKGWASGGYVKSSRRVPQCKSKAWGMVCTVLVRRPATAAGFTAHLRTLTAACASHVACVAGVAIYARLCELMVSCVCHRCCLRACGLLHVFTIDHCRLFPPIPCRHKLKLLSPRGG